MADQSRIPVNLSIALLMILAAALVGIVLWHRSVRTPRPHVVLIIVDTLRADRLGCYGHAKDASPEIDELAARGVRFDHAISQTSWTRPSVASTLTSLHPRTVGIHTEREGILADRFLTLAEILDGQGYRTIGATANPHLNTAFNFHQGFDEYVDSLQASTWIDSQAAPHYPELPSARDLFRITLTVLDAESEPDLHAPHYIQLNVMDVHETWRDARMIRKEFKGLFPGIEDPRERRYLQAVRQVSADVGWFVSQLALRDGWDDLLIIVSSDHGEGLSSHPDVPLSEGHGFLLFESQVRVPLILYRTSEPLPGGLVVERPVRLLDLVPTLLEQLRIPTPRGLAGVSLLPLVEGRGDAALPPYFTVETHFRSSHKLALYTRDWKFFDNRDRHPGLDRYGLHPAGELENGAANDRRADHPELVERMIADLEDWERTHPTTPSTLSGQALSEKELEQLRSLGYLE